MPEPAQPAGVEVGGQAWVDGGEHALGDVGVVGHDRAAGRTAVGLVGREGDDVDALGERRWKRPPAISPATCEAS